MPRAGVIEATQSPWAPPAVLVPKVDGLWTFFVDYRRRSAVTVKEVYSIPRRDE